MLNRPYLTGLAMIVGTMLIVLAAKARADEITAGRGVICDTAAQTEQFIRINGESNPEAALAAVNKDKLACAVMPVVYVRREKVSQLTVNGLLVEITRITVMAAADGHGGWRQVLPNDQFTVFAAAGTPV
jgi:hypothetical protein